MVYLLGIIILIVVITIILLTRSHPVAKYWYGKYLSWVGIQYKNNIYTLTSLIQLPISDSIFFDIILIRRATNYLTCIQLFNINSICVPLTFLPPGYFMRYMVDGDWVPIPYYEGSPFFVTKGELVFYQLKKAAFGMAHREVQRSTYWPLSLS